jgi:hypothetical protein
VASDLGHLAWRFRIVVDASGPAGLEDDARKAAFERVAGAEVAVAALGRPTADRSDGPVCLVARENGAVRCNQCRHLRAHSFEHLCRWRPRCNHCRDAAQRGLLLHESVQLDAVLVARIRRRGGWAHHVTVAHSRCGEHERDPGRAGGRRGTHARGAAAVCRPSLDGSAAVAAANRVALFAGQTLELGAVGDFLDPPVVDDRDRQDTLSAHAGVAGHDVVRLGARPCG